MQQATGAIGRASSGSFVALLVLASALVGQTGAEHALSEVWSEGDGLQMKYLTNHDDLLSTRGSELSLGSSEAPTKQAGGSQPPQDASGAEEGAPNSAGEPSGESSSSGLGEGNEEGADSSRQSERVPAAGPQQKQPRQRFNEPPARYRQAQEGSQRGESGGDQEQEEVDEGSTASQKRPARYPESESASFGAALEQADEGDESASVDHGADEQHQQQPQESAKFRPPGRLFKEALKMGPAQVQELDEKPSGQQQELESANNEQSELGQNEANGKQASEEAAAAAAAANQEGGEEAATGAEPTGAGEPDFNDQRQQQKPEAAGEERAFRPRQNMIDFDRLSAGAPSPRQRPHGGEAQRPRRPQLVGGSQRHQQPAEQRPFAGSFAEQRHHMAAAGSTSQQRLPATPVLRSQANYFRGLQQQQAPSPDNERDNFISPGHFPGSMPHLTQAASEPVAEKAPEALEAAKPAPVASPTSTSASQQVASDSGGPNAVVHQVSASEQKPQMVAQVTPQPEAQPESQQIMAPILLSTTTMAPMSAGEAANVNATSAAAAAATTVPSLKRFKFRKYR